MFNPLFFYEAGLTKLPTMIMVIDTTKTMTGSSGSNQISIPLYNYWSNYAYVDWGDGTNTQYTASPGFLNHTYSVAGIYTIKIKTRRLGIRFVNMNGDRLKLVEIKHWGGSIAVGQSYQGCSNLKLDNVEGVFSVENINLADCFGGCSSITTIKGINDWNILGLRDINGFFAGCTKFNQLLTWNTANITNMANLFASCQLFDQPVNFDLSNCLNIGGMFSGCISFNQEISLITAKVINMGALFNGCSKFNKPVTLDTSKVTTMSSMFSNMALFNSAINLSDTSKVTTMSAMFYNSPRFNKPVNFNTVAVTQMNQMFHNCTDFNQDVSMFNVENCTANNSMFLNGTSFNQDVSMYNFNKNTFMFGFLNGKSAASYSTLYYSNLLIKMRSRFVGVGRTNTNKTFEAGGIKYNSSASSARAELIADGWVITDGGLA